MDTDTRQRGRLLSDLFYAKSMCGIEPDPNVFDHRNLRSLLSVHEIMMKQMCDVVKEKFGCDVLQSLAHPLSRKQMKKDKLEFINTFLSQYGTRASCFLNDDSDPRIVELECLCIADKLRKNGTNENFIASFEFTDLFDDCLFLSSMFGCHMASSEKKTK
jgi:hypothetical protein